MGILKEFKEFALRGNVIDLAVGVVIGGAFGKIVTSLVNDIIMPPIGFLTGGVDFSQLQYVLREANATEGVEQVAIMYGNFVNVVIQFLIIAFCIFMVIKGINSLKKKEEIKEDNALPVPTKEETLLTEIRDILKNK
ncbi:large-conductance mechanosensitive channel protein MscL [Sphingobacterium corticibacter]|uniref:Large-conductance mechanosensitive channel n=1 Tax=Sphingobacterium corticibacter TaxID=2171749 RepID=A0A2T8HH15_9SPHI|nr:large-conductance mechanosensitive channel protein MscL [Sphingobacterium corticibacter]PVH24738.1 large conductance mechanosensitive channel protein MscL [Sphingobacterium corticibacter]